MYNFFFLYGYHSRFDVRVMTAQHSCAVRICGHFRDPSQAFPLKTAGEAEAGHDVLLPVARREGRVCSQKDKSSSVSDYDRRLAFRMAGHINQLDALVSEQINDPMIRPERRTTVKWAAKGDRRFFRRGIESND